MNISYSMVCGCSSILIVLSADWCRFKQNIFWHVRVDMGVFWPVHPSCYYTLQLYSYTIALLSIYTRVYPLLQLSLFYCINIWKKRLHLASRLQSIESSSISITVEAALQAGEEAAACCMLPVPASKPATLTCWMAKPASNMYAAAIPISH